MRFLNALVRLCFLRPRKGGSEARKSPDFVDENPQNLDGKPEDTLKEFVRSDLHNPGLACLYRRPTPGLMDIFGDFALETQCSTSVLEDGEMAQNRPT